MAPRRRLLHHGKSLQQLRKMADGHAGDGKVLDRPLGVDAPVGAGGDVVFAEQVMLAPDFTAFSGMLSVRVMVTVSLMARTPALLYTLMGTTALPALFTPASRGCGRLR
ncbi:MAG: hypothetical protein U1E35_02065 [Rhodospirillales bacterium]